MNLSRTENEQYGNRNQSKIEAAHDQVSKGEIDVEEVRQRLLDEYDDAEIQAIINLYAQAYGDSGLTAEEVLEEILCDSIGKKTKVASEVAKSLGLHNVKVVNARAETLQETFDWVVSRAVTSLENFLPWVKGKYTRGILYLKGGDLAEEISRAMQTQHFPAGFIRVWKISDWIDNPFFDTKMVLHIPAPTASLYL